jgi:hypothetical protein
MANQGERLINVVNRTSRRRSNRLEPKGQRSGHRDVCDLSWTSSTPGEQSEPDQPGLNVQNVVNPMGRLEKRQADRKGSRRRSGQRKAEKAKAEL